MILDLTKCSSWVRERSRASRRRQQKQPGKSVLFVCAGNICRSPAAMAVLKSYLKKHRMTSDVWVDSAGTMIDREQLPVNLRMRFAGWLRGYRLSGRTRSVRRTDLDRFDLVIGMDTGIMSYLRQLHSNPKATVCKLSDFLPAERQDDVPDPMHQPNHVFFSVLNMLELACPRIIQELKRVDRKPDNKTHRAQESSPRPKFPAVPELRRELHQV